MNKPGSVLAAVVLTIILLQTTAISSELSDNGIEVEPVWDLAEYITLAELWEQSEDYWHEGDFESCISVLSKIIAIDPKQTEAYENAAWLLDSTDRIFEGFDLLVQNVLANPRNPDSYFELGMKYYYMGGFKEAVQKFERSAEYGESSITERMLAHAYERVGDRDKTIAMFASALGHDPNDAAALTNLMRVLRRVPLVHDPTALWHRPEPRQ